MSDQNSVDNEEVVDINELVAQRREKLNAMREAGQAFPNDFRRKDISDDLHIAYGDKDKEELEEMPMNDFSNLVEKYDLDVSIIDGIFYDVVNKLFEERSL